MAPCGAHALQRGPRPRRKVVGSAALFVASGLVVAAWRRGTVDVATSNCSTRAWLGPSSAMIESAAVSADHTSEGQQPNSGRRQLLTSGTAATVGAAGVAVGSWVAAPQEAAAFRSDRIFTSKETIVPKIRSAYQKIEGLRDDIYLQVESSDGTRWKLQSRPADWYRGLDRTLAGQVVLAPKNGCSEYSEQVPDGSVVLVPRGKCSFATKMKFAKAAGAQSVVVYDEKVSRLDKTDREIGGGLAARRSLGASPNTGGVAIAEYVKGITVMAAGKNETTPDISGVMISRDNGTAITEVIKAGGSVKILGTDRFEFPDGIDDFIKNKELKAMMNQMEIYSNVMRISKDDMMDPILVTLGKDRKAFKKAVESKDYGEIRKTFQKWNDDLDPMGQWELTETE